MTPTRVALITGGTRGIGLGIARALASEGWRLALCGQRSESDVADVIRSFDGRARYLRADVSSASDRRSLLDWIDQEPDGIHALVNNAGRAPRARADLLESTEASFEELIRVNLQGPYFLTQQIAARMIAARERHPDNQRAIVFITSVSAEMVSTNRGEYCVTKAALAMAVKLFAVRLAEHRIPVYEVRPGIIETDMTAPVRDKYDERIASGLVPQRRWGTPEDVGKVVAALLRGDFPYATGSVINVDGGLAVPRL
jgi:NAD(P)-dependent dehydrogenase (short-subunit alcohol dehydrogenase family)